MQIPPSSPRHAVVIGAGIVGLGTAWRLQRDGWQVTVIEREHPGAGASADNGAQLSYAHVAPLAAPAVWRQLPKLLLAPDSPLKFRPQLDPRQWAWGLRFLAACRADVARQTSEQLLVLALESRAAFERLMREEALDCDFTPSGKLVLYPDANAFEAAQRQIELLHRLGGPPQQALTPDQCVELEPTLAHYAPQTAGGVHTASECAADCLKVCQGLHERLRARGVHFQLGSEVRSWVREGNRIAAVRTDDGEIAADAFVLAAGTGSARLGAALGLDLPVYPLKGYSITLAVDEMPEAAPRVSVTDAARKLVFARLGGRLRVAGMAELMGEDRRLHTERADLLRMSTREIFPSLAPHSDAAHAWTGLRPTTPTGRPLLGKVPGAPDNLLLNTGHGMLGFTLAMGSAERIATALRERFNPG